VKLHDWLLLNCPAYRSPCAPARADVLDQAGEREDRQRGKPRRVYFGATVVLAALVATDLFVYSPAPFEPLIALAMLGGAGLAHRQHAGARIEQSVRQVAWQRAEQLLANARMTPS
jgi:hypothetical protein